MPVMEDVKESQTKQTKKSGAATSAPVGGYVLAKDPIQYNVGRASITIKVRNTGDRPIQVGSHFHFFEVNRALEFDRAATFGMRLNIPSTTAVRFEPGDETKVSLVPFGGKQHVCGFNNLVDGWTGTGPAPGYSPQRTEAVRRLKEFGFKSKEAA